MQQLHIPRHPKALWYFSAMEAFYCFAIGATTSFLILYLIYKLHIPDTRAYEIFAVMNSLIYILPLFGGYVGEKLGYILAVTVGLGVVIAGFLLLSVPDVTLMYWGVACFAAGGCLITPNVNAILSLHYEEGSLLRNSAFTLYFLIYNIGFLVSPLLTGFLSLYNDRVLFLLTASSVAVALLIFIRCVQQFDRKLYTRLAPQVLYKLHTRLGLTLLFVSTTLGLAFFLLHQKHFNDQFLSLILLVVILCVAFSARKLDREGRLKVFTFIILCIVSIAFWTLYMLVPSFLTVFIYHNVNRNIFGIIFPPSCYYSSEAFFVILLGLFFSWLWRRCAEIKKDISLTMKFALALLSIGLGYLVLFLAVNFANSQTHLINSLWIVLAYFFVAMGELLISPIALAMVGVLMPRNQQGLGMGIWQAFIGLSAIISGFIANFVSPPLHGSPTLTNPIYLHAFLKMGLCTLVIGTVIFLLNSKIKKYLYLSK